MTRKEWTPAHDAILRQLYRGEMTRFEAAAMMGRSLHSLENRASRLGLADRRPRLDTRVDDAWERIVAACADGKPRTFAQLASELNLKSAAVKYLMTSRRALGLAHIAGFKKVLGHWRALWLPEPGADAQSPNGNWKAQTDAPPRPTARKWRIPEQHEIIRAFYGMGVSA